MIYETVRVRHEESVCFLQLHRPEAANSINAQLVDECTAVVRQCAEASTVIVVEGLPEVFCGGGDLRELRSTAASGAPTGPDPQALYDLWWQLATGPCVTIAHVRGKANAGGMGFVAACDIVLAGASAEFGLSELLFGLLPACVLPFLVRRIGFQRAHYLALTTRPISSGRAHEYGLVDACDSKSEELVRTHLLRLRRLSKQAIARYKSYITSLYPSLADMKAPAIAANRQAFSDPAAAEAIARYVDTGEFPWEPRNESKSRR